MVKNLPASAGDIRDPSSIPGSGRSPGGGHGNPLQYSYLENPHGQRSPEGYCIAMSQTHTQTSINKDKLPFGIGKTCFPPNLGRLEGVDAGYGLSVGVGQTPGPWRMCLS